MHNADPIAEPVTSDDTSVGYAACIEGKIAELRELLGTRDRSWLAELLHAKGVTQQAIAQSLRVNQATVSRDLAMRRRARGYLAEWETELASVQHGYGQDDEDR